MSYFQTLYKLIVVFEECGCETDKLERTLRQPISPTFQKEHPVSLYDLDILFNKRQCGW